MDSVHNNQGTDDPSEIATICALPCTPHDIDDDPGEEADIPSLLFNRAPSTKRVAERDQSTVLINHLPVFAVVGQDALFCLVGERDTQQSNSSDAIAGIGKNTTTKLRAQNKQS